MDKKELTLEEQMEALTKQLTDSETKSKQYEATIAEQRGQLKTQASELEKTIKQRDRATTDLETVTKQRDKATSEAGDKATEVRQLRAEAEANEKVIEDYANQLRTYKAKGEGGAPVVNHQGQLYRVVAPKFHFEGKEVTAESLTSDATLVAKLVEQESGVLQLVEPQV